MSEIKQSSYSLSFRDACGFDIEVTRVIIATDETAGPPKLTRQIQFFKQHYYILRFFMAYKIANCPALCEEVFFLCKVKKVKLSP
jgi:hypothetical protein